MSCEKRGVSFPTAEPQVRCNGCSCLSLPYISVKLPQPQAMLL